MVPDLVSSAEKMNTFPSAQKAHLAKVYLHNKVILL